MQSLGRVGCLVVGVALAALAIFVMWLTGPLFQEIVYGLYSALPSMIVLGIGAVIVGLVLTWELDSNGGDVPLLTGLVATVMLCVFVIYGAIAGPITTKNIYDEYGATATEIEKLPNTEELRYQPFEVASKIGNDRTSDPKIELGEFEPVINEEGEVSWTSPRIPTSRYARKLYGGQPGVLTINPDPASKPKVDETKFRYSEGLSWHRNWEWQAHKTNYLSQKTNPYYIVTDSGPVLVSPYITRSLKWAGIFPYMLPEWGGVIVIHPSGKTEDLSPEQAQQRYPDQRLFPKDFARRVMDSFVYIEGYRNTIIGPHDKEATITDPSEDNPFPYLTPSDDGPMWVGAAVPYSDEEGANTSLSRLYNIDATTGNIEYKNFDDTDAMIGPEQAANRLGTIFPQYDWGKTVKRLEPLPVVVNGTIYWQITITNNNYAEVMQTVFMNAGNTEDVLIAESYEEAQSFVAGDTSALKSASAGGMVAGGTSATTSDSSAPATPAPESDSPVQLAPGTKITGTCEQQDDGTETCEFTVEEAK